MDLSKGKVVHGVGKAIIKMLRPGQAWSIRGTARSHCGGCKVSKGVKRR